LEVREQPNALPGILAGTTTVRQARSSDLLAFLSANVKMRSVAHVLSPPFPEMYGRAVGHHLAGILLRGRHGGPTR
jgi:hypothetical protein